MEAHIDPNLEPNNMKQVVFLSPFCGGISQINGCMNAWIDRWIGRWVDRWTDGQMDRSID